MQFEIFVPNANPYIYAEFSRFIFDDMKDTIKTLVDHNSKHYKIREPLVLSSSLIDWVKTPKEINLEYYVKNCLELRKYHGKYIIRINPNKLIKGTKTPVIKLIRMLEYGTNRMPEYSLIRKVFAYYSKNYLTLFNKFVERRLSYEHVPVRRGSYRKI